MYTHLSLILTTCTHTSPQSSPHVHTPLLNPHHVYTHLSSILTTCTHTSPQSSPHVHTPLPNPHCILLISLSTGVCCAGYSVLGSPLSYRCSSCPVRPSGYPHHQHCCRCRGFHSGIDNWSRLSTYWDFDHECGKCLKHTSLLIPLPLLLPHPLIHPLPLPLPLPLLFYLATDLQDNS